LTVLIGNQAPALY